MDWIERLTGWSPDGGNGMVELFLALLPLLPAVYLIRWAWRKTRWPVKP